jgi:pseudaminic acid synthase
MSAENTIHIDGRPIGGHHPPFVIAEMSGNHNQSLDRALKIVEAAAASGVHALKLQTYTADTMTLDIHDGDFLIQDPKNLWNGRNLYDLYDEAHTPWAWHAAIFAHARELGITIFSTAFDATAVDFLEELECPAYKIASFENVDLALIRKAAATRKPIIISTGMATVGEIDEAVTAAREAGAEDLILLQCTSTYPASPSSTHLRTIPHMRELFGVQVGLSDHTLGIGVAVASVAFGSTVIEKHFTLDRDEGGVDAAFSLEPQEMKVLVEESERAWQAAGKVYYGPTDREKASLMYRRSLYVTVALSAGDVITRDNVQSIRPGAGLHPKYLDEILGKRVIRDVPRGAPMSWDLLG